MRGSQILKVETEGKWRRNPSKMNKGPMGTGSFYMFKELKG